MSGSGNWAYDITAANLAGDADHDNLDVESDGLHIQEATANLAAGTAGSFQVCGRTAPDVNLLDIVPWSGLAVGSQYCASDELGSHTMTLLTVRGVSPGSSVTVHVDTWPCAAECWSTAGAS
jgi:hypothetical protein